MTPAPFAINADALHAFADGQLPAEQRAVVEAYLAIHPDAAALVGAWQRQNDAIETLFAPAASEALPQRLSPHAIARQMRHDRRRSVRNIAAAIALLVIGSGIGWYGRDYVTSSEAASDRVIDAAITAHALYVKEKLHAVEVAAEVPHLMSWLSNRISAHVEAPDLSSNGFIFLGGRLLPGDGDEDDGPAAQLMYQNAEAKRVTVYLTPPLVEREPDEKYAERRSLDAFFWSGRQFTCTVVGDLDDRTMDVVARTVFTQLSWRPD